MSEGLTSSEWAAWVQAIGSVGAIAVAIWLGERQVKAARIATAEEAVRRAALSLEHVRVVLVQASVRLKRIVITVRQCRPDDWQPAMHHQATLLQQIRDSVESLAMRELPSIAVSEAIVHLPAAFDELISFGLNAKPDINGGHGIAMMLPSNIDEQVAAAIAKCDEELAKLSGR